MDDIYKKLLRFGCMDKSDYNDREGLLVDISQLRAEFLGELETKNNNMQQSLKELHEQETEVIARIKRLFDSGEFKRAYKSMVNKDLVNEYLTLLEDNQIECTKGLKRLRKIENDVKEIVAQQKYKDQTNLKAIKKQVGSKIWADFSTHFQSEEFLAVMDKH